MEACSCREGGVVWPLRILLAGSCRELEGGERKLRKTKVFWRETGA